MIHSSRLVAIGADPNYAALFDQGGNGSLPGISGLPAPWQTPSTSPQRQPGGAGDPQKLKDCLTDCNARNYHGLLDEAGWVACTIKCKAQFGAGQGEFATPVYTDGCDTCGTSDVPACFACAWSYAAKAGIEVGLVALALVGLYLWLK